MENEQLGIVRDLTDIWTPEQRERFLRDCRDEELPMQINLGQKRPYEEMSSDDEPQVGRGQEDGAGTSNEDNVFTVESVKQVNVKSLKPRV